MIYRTGGDENVEKSNHDCYISFCSIEDKKFVLAKLKEKSSFFSEDTHSKMMCARTSLEWKPIRSAEVDGLKYSQMQYESMTRIFKMIYNDLVNRIVEFVRVVYGADTLEENLAFIAKALGNKGNTSREIIRNYFLKDFYADHCKIYQKRPIYWMFDSGKKNGFKALVYLHRWDADTTGRVYNNYLSPLLRTYAQQIVQENNVISSSSDARTVSLAQKRLDKLKLQQEECEKYEKDIAHLAALRIALDLDDGVKVNYVKAQTAADGKNLNVLAPIK